MGKRNEGTISNDEQEGRREMSPSDMSEMLGDPSHWGSKRPVPLDGGPRGALDVWKSDASSGSKAMRVWRQLAMELLAVSRGH